MGVPMTRSGYDKLQDEVDEMKKSIPLIQKSIQIAREKGDLRENAEYHAARESLGMLEAQIADKLSMLAQAEIISPQSRDCTEVQFGARVKVLDLEFEEEEEYQVVGAGEANAMKNKILSTSPLGQAMLNKKVGDQFTVEAPGGQLRYRVIEISY